MGRYCISLVVLAAMAAGNACAQPAVVPPTRQDVPLKGPVRVVQTAQLWEYCPDDGAAFAQVVTNYYNAGGQLVWVIEQSADGLYSNMAYHYDGSGRLEKVSQWPREAYTDLYHYTAQGQLESVERRFLNEPFDIYNTTWVVVERDKKGRPLRIAGTPGGDKEVTTYVYEYRSDGLKLTEQSSKYGTYVQRYHNRQGQVDSLVYKYRKDVYTYDASGNLLREFSTGLPDFPKGATTEYKYPSEPYMTDRYGNWLQREVTVPSGETFIEMRTILYYDD